jgi:hypothetical protein
MRCVMGQSVLLYCQTRILQLEYRAGETELRKEWNLNRWSCLGWFEMDWGRESNLSPVSLTHSSWKTNIESTPPLSLHLHFKSRRRVRVKAEQPSPRLLFFVLLKCGEDIRSLFLSLSLSLMPSPSQTIPLRLTYWRVSLSLFSLHSVVGERSMLQGGLWIQSGPIQAICIHIRTYRYI